MTSRSRQRRLGQNFLVDRSVAVRTADQLQASPARVVEVGPGRGALTGELLERFARVLALELDERLLPELEQRFSGAGLELHHADALKEPLEPLLLQDAPWQLAANLPYSVGTAIVRRLLPMSGIFTRLVVMLQREVAERLVAPPGARGHGLMALERAAYAEATIVLQVPPQAFRPRPKVHSSVVVLDLRPSKYDPAQLESALAVASHALTRPRKKLINAVRGAASAEQVAAAGINCEQRPGELDLEQWLAISRCISQDHTIGQ